MFFAGFSAVEGGQGGHGITGVVLGRNGLQSDGGTVVEGDVSEVALGNFNLFHGVEVRDVVSHVERDFVLFHVAVGAHGLVVVVEGDTRRNHVDQSEALVRHGGLEQGSELLLGTRKRTGNKGATEVDGHGTQVDGLGFVGGSFLLLRADVSRRRVLALRQTVDAVVLDDVDHVHVAANGVNELSDTDGR